MSTWVARKYHLQTCDRQDLDSAIRQWLRQRGVTIRPYRIVGSGQRLSYAFGSGRKVLFVVTELPPMLSVYYRHPILYVYLAKDSPKASQDIHEALFTPYVTQRGGSSIEGNPVHLEGLAPVFREFESLDQGIALQEPPSQSQAQAVASVHWESRPTRIRVATEEVSVPPGVTVKVKRSRTVEHTIDIDWSLTGEVNLGVGIKQLASASIRGEIERSYGQKYQQSETIEYEVELSGEEAHIYRLTWTEVWQTGSIEVQHTGTTQIVPFRFRERAELEVVPT